MMTTILIGLAAAAILLYANARGRADRAALLKLPDMIWISPPEEVGRRLELPERTLRPTHRAFELRVPSGPEHFAVYRYTIYARATNYHAWSLDRRERRGPESSSRPIYHLRGNR